MGNRLYVLVAIGYQTQIFVFHLLATILSGYFTVWRLLDLIHDPENSLHISTPLVSLVMGLTIMVTVESLIALISSMIAGISSRIADGNRAAHCREASKGFCRELWRYQRVQIPLGILALVVVFLEDLFSPEGFSLQPVWIVVWLVFECCGLYITWWFVIPHLGFSSIGGKED